LFVGSSLGLTIMLGSILGGFIGHTLLGILPFWGMMGGLYIMLLFSLAVGFGVGSNEIKPVEKIRWSWKKALSHNWYQFPWLILLCGFAGWVQALIDDRFLGLHIFIILTLLGVFVLGVGRTLIEGLLNGLGNRIGFVLLFFLVTQLVVGLGDTLFGIGSGLVGVLVFGIYMISIAGISPHEVQIRDQPNEGVWRSSRNAVIIGLFFGLFFGINGTISSVLFFNVIMGLFWGVFWILVGGVGSGLFFGGGASVIQHFALRLVCTLNNHAPLNLVPFLDHAAEHILLRKVGGGYMFVHRMLLEYFAGLEEEQQRKNDTPDDRPT
jgi:hypothetical protein